MSWTCYWSTTFNGWVSLCVWVSVCVCEWFLYVCVSWPLSVQCVCVWHLCEWVCVVRCPVLLCACVCAVCVCTVCEWVYQWVRWVECECHCEWVCVWVCEWVSEWVYSVCELCVCVCVCSAVCTGGVLFWLCLTRPLLSAQVVLLHSDPAVGGS